ncbi:MAG: hypothetical protein U9R64_12195 [Pseudomonadota bacterium]|nr:hypothetical protein [Pseudomonadota bacterium]
MMQSCVIFNIASGLPLRTSTVPEFDVAAQAGDGEAVVLWTADMTDLSLWRYVDGAAIMLEAGHD